jgi:glycosyltransferase involved in cell wall biosynthesis
MAVIRQVSQRYPTKVEFRLFGCELSEPGFAALEQDFPWKLAGQLRSTQVASLFNQADIFVDFSEFQAFGLTSLEAMAMGLAVIVPSNGGTGVYARDGENCLVVDGCDQHACVETLTHLVEDDSLRSKLQTNAISTAARFYPELPALNMLKALFKDRP